MALVNQFLGRQNTIPIPVPFVRLLGDYAAAAFLAQCLYWTDRSTEKDGWFYKSREEWAEELCMTEKQVRRCMEACAPYVEIERRGIPARNYYRPNQTKIAEALRGLMGPTREAEEGQQELPKRANKSSPKGPNSEAQKGQQVVQEKGQLSTEPTTKPTQNLRQKDVVSREGDEVQDPETIPSLPVPVQLSQDSSEAGEHQPTSPEDVPPGAAPLPALREALAPWSADKLIGERATRQGERGWASLSAERIRELRQAAFDKRGNRYRGDLCALLDAEITKKNHANGTDAAEKDWLA